MSLKCVLVLGGWGNTKSVFDLNGKICGPEQIRPPIMDPKWYTCSFLVLNSHVTDTRGTAFMETRGLEPVMISCTTVDNPDQLQYIRYGTRIEDVSDALIYYDCPMDLKTVCSRDLNVAVDVDVNQSQNAEAKVGA